MDGISQCQWKARLKKLVIEMWYSHKHTMQVVQVQYYVTLYIQTSVSENARNADLDRPSTIKYDATPKFLSPKTNLWFGFRRKRVIILHMSRKGDPFY